MSTLEKPRDSQTLKALLGLRDLVLCGEVSPGERVQEVSLSARLGVSRTPLRAALLLLQQEGLLEHIPSGGFAVRSFTQDDVFDAIELRGVLEGTAARLAAERGATAAKLSAIKQLVAELDLTFRDRIEDLMFDRYVELNAEFHVMLASLAGSETIRRELERASNLPFASPSAFLAKQDDVPAFRRSLTIAQHQHREIVLAIELRQGSRAENLAREHARIARSNLEFIMDQDRSLMSRIPGLALVSA